MIQLLFENLTMWDANATIKVTNHNGQLLDTGSFIVGSYVFSDVANVLEDETDYFFEIFNQNKVNLFSYYGHFSTGKLFTFTLQERDVACYRVNDSAQIPCFKVKVDPSVNNTLIYYELENRRPVNVFILLPY